MKRTTSVFAAIVMSFFFLSNCLAEGLSPEMQAKVDAKAKAFQAWSTDAKIVAAVKEYNINPPSIAKEMTNDKWKTLTIMDPAVTSLTKNPLAEHLKSLKDDSISEAFVSGADGGKVAFLAKTTSWTHKGKPKHDEPMAGKSWQGPVEVDASTGKQQIQVSVPVLDGATPIGSIVIGLAVAKL